jgi:hypothetical protein
MIRRHSILTIFAALVAIGVAYLSAFLPGGAPGWAPWLMSFGIAALMTATMALGAVRNDRIGRLWIPLACTFVTLAAGFGAALYLPPLEGAAPPVLWLGLPAGAAIILYGIGFLPLLVVPLAYALTFDEMTLDAADLERLRATARAQRPGADPSGAVGSVPGGAPGGAPDGIRGELGDTPRTTSAEVG